ncbi:MAG: FkbM family methyltransferase [Kiloniellales bacterium]|nr:FkbM family methyltransferase [Kiloniellales bacterium]MDJ0971966.1 FkbM family methyltransferase [Kiloniellales bacterium]MDJ0983354.1 FkbM family methyltransferase [Kiloniellales bacterium]
MIALSELRGLARSVSIYYGNPLRSRAHCSFYRQFIDPGDLCFDVGAHVGNHVRTMLKLGARVVAVEPQPRFQWLLHRFYGDNPEVTLVDKALGAAPGEAELYVSSRYPTVTTLSRDWIKSVGRAASFSEVSWDGRVTVEVTTLDTLIAQHGRPAYCKIDVEGFEPEVLKGLGAALPSLSFEFIPAALDGAFACIERLQALGDYEFNVSMGEQMRFELPQWSDAGALGAWLDNLAIDDLSGDVYCRLKARG